MRRALRVHRLLVAGFGYAQPFVNWSCFLVGLARRRRHRRRPLPPFSGSWWARLTSVLLWLLVAQQGYQPLADDADDGPEQKDEPAS